MTGIPRNSALRAFGRILGLFLLVTGIGLLDAFPTEAWIYKWVDENGQVHITDNPSDVPAEKAGDVRAVPTQSRLPSVIEPETPATDTVPAKTAAPPETTGKTSDATLALLGELANLLEGEIDRDREISGMMRNWPAIKKTRKLLATDLPRKEALLKSLKKIEAGVTKETEWLKINYETEAAMLEGMQGGYNSRIVKSTYVRAKKQLTAGLPEKERMVADLRARTGTR